jgi:hypothetical protein
MRSTWSTQTIRSPPPQVGGEAGGPQGRRVGPVRRETASPRDLALAYAIAGSPRALAGLQEAARRAPDDTEVLLYLAERHRNDGKPDLAIPGIRAAPAAT